MQNSTFIWGMGGLRLHPVLAAVKKCFFYAPLALCLLGHEARGQVGTEWPMPADLSASEPVCLNKSREVKGGDFVEGMIRLS